MKERKMLARNRFSTPSAVNFAYADWFDARIDEFAKTHKGRFEPASMFKRRNGLFITLSFNQNPTANSASDHEPIGSIRESELGRFSDFYNRLCRLLIGRNYHRQSFQNRMPLAIATLDVNGSRYWKSIGDLQNLHIHSIWLLTNETISEFRSLISDEAWIASVKERFGVRQFDVQALDLENQTKQGVSLVSSYTAKFIAHNQNELVVGDEFRIFPILSEPAQDRPLNVETRRY